MQAFVSFAVVFTARLLSLKNAMHNIDIAIPSDHDTLVLFQMAKGIINILSLLNYHINLFFCELPVIY